MINVLPGLNQIARVFSCKGGLWRTENNRKNRHRNCLVLQRQFFLTLLLILLFNIYFSKIEATNNLSHHEN
jgi:hypothetical protein